MTTGILLKRNTTNSQKGDYTILYEYDEMDEMGNYTQVKLIYEDTKKLQRFIPKGVYLLLKLYVLVNLLKFTYILRLNCTRRLDKRPFETLYLPAF
jgi:hypothetical protein